MLLGTVLAVFASHQQAASTYIVTQATFQTVTMVKPGEYLLDKVKSNSWLPLDCTVQIACGSFGATHHGSSMYIECAVQLQLSEEC